ncbi:MAG TPA: FGGY family carbohydrate kinase, partial [Blastocatellia bacterium]|nr:FGGY family carbohydrate kinase [Blastocatellia bacterium]
MILAIDLGSTSFKAAVLDKSLRIRGSHSSRLKYSFAPGGKIEFEVKPSTLAMGQAIRGAIADAGIRPEHIKAISVTSQAQTFTVLNSKGQPKIPFISWQDSRPTKTCEKLVRSKALPNFGKHCSFVELIPQLQVCQVRHMQETRRGLIQTNDQVINLPSYLCYLLTGRSMIDNNLAAMSGLYSLIERGWWSKALKVCGLKEHQLPSIVPIGSKAGTTTKVARQFGLPAGIPLILAGNDQTAGAFGASLHKKNAMLITLGTAQVAYLCKRSLLSATSGLIRGPYPGGLFYGMMADSCGGSLVNWTKTILSNCETDEAFFSQAAKALKGSQGLIFEYSDVSNSG